MTESVLHQTIQNLEGVLPELEEQERHLRNQLDAVVQQATSARSALEHLRVLTSADHSDRQPVAAGSAFAGVSADATGAEVASAAVAAEPGAEAVAEPAVEASVVPQPRTATSPRTKRRPAKKAAAKKPAAAKPRAKKAATKPAVAAKQPGAAEQESGSLLDAALEVLKKAGEPMRPRDINTALGRDATPGQIESVRNTLDRAVKKTDLVTRPGRGTYAAA
ncbi:winged helix-turn-helix domain-containing protein (plasmid) [Streptomyces sp. BHT-5-2]|uniref:winged helix-turn-helix domain-containing protein n=1 Tax=unclassified Streptomyces TaxID=2593676 RepID=UPI001C8D7623|nr:winged helix-turn-helix domain-containing protein [Streptomyces sp. BHT-5-2]QZL07738.1 winged helix-turn-helix domain-containing protein [Streptomyces sp. BHT-5-2]